MKKLILKATVRLLIFAVISALLNTLNSSAVVLINEVALGQLENSNEAFILFNFIQNIRPIVTMLYIIFAALIFWPVVVDVYKIVKNKYSKEETKE